MWDWLQTSKRTPQAPVLGAAVSMACLAAPLATHGQAVASAQQTHAAHASPTAHPGLASHQALDTHTLPGALLPGSAFHAAQEADRAYLKRLNPDALLHHFRVQAGLPPKADHLGGWESGGGGIFGHYLSACAWMAVATNDDTLKQRVAYMVDEALLCMQHSQAARGPNDTFGGLVGFGSDVRYFSNMAKGQMAYPPVNGWYAFHKTMAGLRDAHLLLPSEHTKQAFEQICDWSVRVTANLTDEQFAGMAQGECGAPQAVLAEAYATFGKRAYLDTALRFEQASRFARHPRGDWSWLEHQHANTAIVNALGRLKVGLASGNADLQRDAQAFTDHVLNEWSWANGGNSQWEAFFPSNAFVDMVDAVCGPETCNSINLLKMGLLLNPMDADATSTRRIDHLERALYGHVLPSIDPSTGGMVYYSSMRPGHYRTFSTDTDSFWCCVGTGMEAHAMAGRWLYAFGEPHTDAGLPSVRVQMYVASRCDLPDRGLTLTTLDTAPESNNIRLRLDACQANTGPGFAKSQSTTPSVWSLVLRWPSWAKNGVSLTINGQRQALQGREPGDWVTLTRAWQAGDQLVFTLPARVSVEALPVSQSKQTNANADRNTNADTQAANQNVSQQHVAFFYGPEVLAGGLGVMDLTPEDFRPHGPNANLANKPMALADAPALAFAGDLDQLAKHIQRLPGEQLAFHIDPALMPDHPPVLLRPMHAIGMQRQMVYWPLVTPNQFEALREQQRTAEAEWLALDNITVDHVRIGEQQPETNHRFAAQGSSSGAARQPHTHWRDTRDWMSYDMAVDPQQPNAVRCVFWGSDGGRTFDLLVDGQTIATVQLRGQVPHQYVAQTFPIPQTITQGKDRVRVRFQAHENSLAGGLYDLRTVRLTGR